MNSFISSVGVEPKNGPNARQALIPIESATVGRFELRTAHAENIDMLSVLIFSNISIVLLRNMRTQAMNQMQSDNKWAEQNQWHK